MKGVDFVDDEISTQKAFTVFRLIEEDEGMRNFKPPQVDSGGSAISLQSRFDLELPSVRIERMQRELDELQKELVELEKEEIPSRMAQQAQSAKQSLTTIDELRAFMHNLVESSSYQDMETKANLDLKEVLERAYAQAVPDKD